MEKLKDIAVCCVLVTYGNRFHLLKQVVEEVLNQGASRVVIIDNGSAEPSQGAIHRLSLENNRVIVQRFPHNEGSAMGFKKGLELAMDTGCDLFWILDDDNLPKAGVLQGLKYKWQEGFARSGNAEKLALLCMRIDRADFQKVLRVGTPDAILPLRNSFMGFHFQQILVKLWERLRTREPAVPQSSAPVRLEAASYGGLFFHRNLIGAFGLPDAAFVLYIDDFDFTYRYTSAGGQIWLIPECEVRDIDQSFYLPKRRGLLYHSALDTSRDAFAYYVVRNSVYFGSRNLVTSGIAFRLNKYLFILFITASGVIRGKFKRLGIIYAAIGDGLSGRLGKRDRYKL